MQKSRLPRNDTIQATEHGNESNRSENLPRIISQCPFPLSTTDLERVYFADFIQTFGKVAAFFFLKYKNYK